MNTVINNITIVYNLKTNQWQPSYSPLPYVVPSPPTATTSGTRAGARNGGGAGLKPTGTGALTDAMSGDQLGSDHWRRSWRVGSDWNRIVGLFIHRKRQAKNRANSTSTATARPQSTHKQNNIHNNNNDQFPHTNASPYDEALVNTVASPPQYKIFSADSDNKRSHWTRISIGVHRSLPRAPPSGPTATTGTRTGTNVHSCAPESSLCAIITSQF